MNAAWAEDRFQAALAASLPALLRPLDRIGYIVGLCNAVQTTRATPPALRLAAAGLQRAGDARAAAFAIRKAAEEEGP
ncbi:MAG: hypothetical protein WDO24_23305 [Pseudomonadota bacterium]